MNRVELLGRLVRDSELRTTQSGKNVATFILAVQKDRPNKDGEYLTDFINCKAFEKKAVNINKYFKKGNQIAITGAISTYTYENKEGVKKYGTEVIIDNFDFIGTANKSDENAQNSENNVQNESKNDENAQLNVESDPFADFGEQIEIKDEDLPW